MEFGNLACTGGFMENAYEYIIKNEGINTNEAYPYSEKVN
jgi:cathepsin L